MGFAEQSAPQGEKEAQQFELPFNSSVLLYSLETRFAYRAAFAHPIASPRAGGHLHLDPLHQLSADARSVHSFPG